MAKPTEGDPTRRIVDVDTFRLWLIGYRAAAIEYKLGIQGVRTTEVNMEANINSGMEDLEEAFHVTVKGYPWRGVPKSLRDALVLQYEQRSLDRSYHIDIEIDKDRLRFIPNSPSIALSPLGFMYLDFGAEPLPPRGLTLFLSDNPRISKGQWLIFDERPTDEYIAFLRAAKGMAEMRGMHLQPTEEQIEIIKETFMHQFNKIRTIPSTLRQLNDVATILEQSRTRGKLQVSRVKI